LSIQNAFVKKFEVLHILKTQLMVPDVLYLSILKKAEQLVSMFVPHWAPPLTLLCFSSPYSINEWLSYFFLGFLEYGGVPHGTRMFAALGNHMEEAYRSIRYDPDEWDATAEYVHYYDSYKELVGKN
jgi:hypothetical protein